MAANPIDLTTLADVKLYLGIKTTETADDAILQSLITGASQYWLDRTVRGSLNSVENYDERYNGNGKQELMLRYYPIVDIALLSVGPFTIPRSADYQQFGWALNDQRDTVILIASAFVGGLRNVHVAYSAGFEETPYDVAEAVTKQVGVNYRRRKTIDQDSLALPEGGGTTRWRSWEVPPEVERIIQIYKPGVPI